MQIFQGSALYVFHPRLSLVVRRGLKLHRLTRFVLVFFPLWFIVHIALPFTSQHGGQPAGLGDWPCHCSYFSKLGRRPGEIKSHVKRSQDLLHLPGNNAYSVNGNPDEEKLTKETFRLSPLSARAKGRVKNIRVKPLYIPSR